MQAAQARSGFTTSGNIKVEPEVIVFSKADPADVVLTCTISEGLTITTIKNYVTPINSSRYSVEYIDSVAVITIFKDYLATQSNGDKSFTVEAGEAKESVKITIAD